ncbi:MAG: hypothetical protein ACJAXF_000043 [Polaribacter sp.]|jgi:hypothetical protein
MLKMIIAMSSINIDSCFQTNGLIFKGYTNDFFKYVSDTFFKRDTHLVLSPLFYSLYLIDF